jgi:hypothetical protein
MPVSKLSAAFALVLSVVLAGPTSADAAFILDFSTNDSTQLASQGLTYNGSSSTTEGQTFSVAGGVLHMNTAQYPGDVYAIYQQQNTFSHTLNAEYTTVLKVTQNEQGIYGTSFGFSDSNASVFVVVQPAGWFIYGQSPRGTFAGPAAFHEFDLKWSGPTHTYTLSIDGTQVATGSSTTGYGGPSTVYFGDGSPTGGDMVADFKSVSYSTSDPNAVTAPAPSGLALVSAAGLSGLAGGLYRRLRRVLFVSS